MASYLKFDEVNISSNRKTKCWDVKNEKSGALLGYIDWYSSWRRYCFTPVENTVFSAGCLEEINNFIKAEMKKKDG